MKTLKIFILLVVLFAVGCGSALSLNEDKPFHIQAHRGAGLAQPENTLECFTVSWNMDVTPEADLRVTKDGVTVCFHEKNFKQVIKQSHDKYLDAGALTERLQRLKGGWGALCPRLEKQIIPAKRLQKMLADAGAPCVPEDIGIDRERLHLSYGQARKIRSRYTVLDLVAEAGWWKSCVDAQFEAGGFWA